MNGSGIGWDGALRDPNAQQPQSISPFDRAPVPRQIAANNSKLATGLNVPFAAWCSWVFVEDDGGADLYIKPGRGGGPAQLATIGRVVWIGDGSGTVGYTTTAPIRPVRLMGCNADDARIYGANGGAVALPAALPTTTQFEATSIKAGDNIFALPVGTKNIIITPDDSNTGTVTNPDASLSTGIWVSATDATNAAARVKVLAGQSWPMLAAGGVVHFAEDAVVLTDLVAFTENI
jgi:hypothetical protein